MRPPGREPALRCAHCRARLMPWPGPLAVVGLVRGTPPPALLRPVTTARQCGCGWTTIWEPLAAPDAGAAAGPTPAPDAGEAPGRPGGRAKRGTAPAHRASPASGHEADRDRPAVKRGRGNPDIRTWHAPAYRPMPRRMPEEPR